MRLDIPLHDYDDAKPLKEPEPGRGLCLSGGGYRAMLFHLGVLWRLNELGILPTLNRISSVSGGSMVAAWLGLRWSTLNFVGATASNFVDEVVGPIRKLATKTLDITSATIGGLTPGKSVNDAFAQALAKHLYADATLQDLPAAPRFVINATTLQTGKLWRFSKPYMGDYSVGLIVNPRIKLAKAVASSAAFPPLLSPSILKVKPSEFRPGNAGANTHPDFMSRIVLSDGGVYDNLGLETCFKHYRTVLVSDAGMMPEANADVGGSAIPQMIRVYEIADSQVRALRKRQLLSCLTAKPATRDGAYWSSNSDIARFPAPKKLTCPVSRTRELATVPTRLKKMPAELQERLINWGYAVCDAAIRSHVDTGLTPPSGFPYARGV